MTGTNPLTGKYHSNSRCHVLFLTKFSSLCQINEVCRISKKDKMETITFTWITTASWKQTYINQSSPGIQRKIFVQIFFTYEGFIRQFCKAFHGKWNIIVTVTLDHFLTKLTIIVFKRLLNLNLDSFWPVFAPKFLQ